MTDRIALLLKAKNITASQFADEIGVQRSNISHVLSGRNKPSLEFIQKILKRYPEINPDWILFGKGPMNMEYNLFSELGEEEAEVQREAVQALPKKQEQMLTPERPGIVSPVEKPEVVKKEEKPVNQEPEQQEQPEVVRVETTQEKNENLPEPRAEKHVEKVLIFFSNRTFREYSPE